MGRKPNAAETVQVTISTTPQVKEYLLQLVRTGLYGKNEAEAAERLITESLRRQIPEGLLIPRT
jgi:hypothetical protein